MPKSKKVQSSEPVDAQPEVEPTPQPQPQPVALTKDEYIKARAIIKQYREEKKSKPKRTCTEKQLQALAAGREANKRFKKQVKPSE